MDFEEVERSIQFLLAQQAQFASDLQQSRELSDQRHAELSRAIRGLTAIAGALVESDQRLGLRMEELTAAQKDLAEAQAETQANLSALTLVVDKYFRDRTEGSGSHSVSSRKSCYTEGGAAPGAQGARRANTGSIQPTSNAAPRDAAPAECNRTSGTRH